MKTDPDKENIPMPEFSRDDAALMVQLVRGQPRQSMDEADAVGALLDRFARFVEKSL
jgi:hypothetical protein